MGRGLRIRQYAYFAIRSSGLSGAEVERRLGMAPDQVLVAGSESTDPMRPAGHAWKLVCDQPGLDVTGQVASVIGRLRPIREALKDLATSEDVVLVLQIVRYLDDEIGEEGDWQHPLLGWHLNLEQLRFLVEIGAEVDADEYG